jgi:flavodoxin
MKKFFFLLLSASLMIPLWGGSARKSCVLYFSWSEKANTHKVAEMIAKQTGSDLIRVFPEKAYSKNYNDVLRRGRKELREKTSCPIKKVTADLKKYNTVFIGTPIWFGTYAPPVRTLLQQYDFKGKKVYFFCTHGRGGPGRFFSDAAKLTAGAKADAAGFSCYGDHVNKIAPQLEKWLKEKVK